MSKTKINSNPDVKKAFKSYPAKAQEKVKHLRELILEAADELEEVDEVEETLKWGEPSYLTKNGSTVRIAWKEKTPDQYGIYFKCTSRLVPTFRKLFKDDFEFENHRAIIFRMNDKVPGRKLKECIKAGLRYHKVKKLENLNIKS